MFQGIEHIGIMANDPATLADWYVRVFDMEVVSHNQLNPPTIFVAGQVGACVEIMPYTSEADVLSGKQKRAVHMAIKVNNLDGAIEMLKERGVRFTETPREFPGGKLIFFQDPEANWLQLIYRESPLR